MNEAILSSDVLGYCRTLRQLRKDGDWNAEFGSFDDYAKARWSLSRARVKLLCNFAKFHDMCKAEGMKLPDSPDNVKPILSIAQKKWLEVWGLVNDFDGQINEAHCKSVMEHFGIGGRKRIPPEILKGMHVRRAAKLLADIGDGEQFVADSGSKALGNNWDEAIQFAIDADQARATNG